jgi:hypothetical protein
MAELERRLADLGERLELPATPPLAGRVGAELRAADHSARPRRGTPRLRLALLAVLAVLLLAAGAAAAVPSTRHAVLEFLGLRAETIERVPKLPLNARAKPSWRLGRPTTLAAARSQLSFVPLLPAALEGPHLRTAGGHPPLAADRRRPPRQRAQRPRRARLLRQDGAA